LDAVQRGALVIEVLPNSPALRAGLIGSSSAVRVEGVNVPVGGDVITAIDGSPVREMADVIAHLARHTVVGQTINLEVIRSGERMEIPLTLAARPSASK
jgi:serine protease Do